VPAFKNPTPAPLLALAIALALGLSACSGGSEEAAPAAAEAPAAAATAPAPTAAEAAANALAALSEAELREKGNAALREQRLYAPAGDNAMEYYLALRQKSAKPDVSAESALMDLMPYTLIAAEQAINEDRFEEAERLLALMNRADPEAPSLGRIREAISSGRTALADRERQEAERAERERLAAEQRAREQAAAPAEPAPVAEAPAAPTPAPAPANPEPAPATPAPAPVAAAPTPAPAAVPAAPRSGAPRPISTPQPPYPREAARSRASGTVVVLYTIGADGRVGDVRVVRARPRGVFERTVQDTVRTWRFEPPGEPVTQTRTFEFSM
jgi:protein TonB